jgi:hypothetical protein
LDGDTAERIAAEDHVDPATVKRATKFTAQVDELDAHVGSRFEARPSAPQQETPVSESHTPDRLVAVPERLVGGGHVAGLSPRLESAEPSDGRLVANVARMTPGRGRCAEAEANARRLAACWNAAQGVPTEALENLSASGWLAGHWQECLAAADHEAE